MSAKNNFMWDAIIKNTDIEAVQKQQKEFAQQILKQGMELQGKQFALFNSIFQNQLEFGSGLFSNALSMLNDNAFLGKKEKKKNNA